jgi:adenylosuccinate synthase
MNAAIIGLGFGDEGKGLVTDYLCSKASNPLVIRYSGGQQAGHTVMKKDVRHIFTNFGSGTLSGAPTYWAPTATIDPVGIMNEYKILMDKGIRPTLFIDSRCPVTTPFEKLHNQNTEKINQHGSCGVGVGQTWEREECMYSLLAGDLRFPSVMEMKIKMIANWYHLNYPLDDYLSEFFLRVRELLSCIDITISHGVPVNFSSRIYEGSQGLLLDQNIGFFPHVTRSNVGLKNIKKPVDEIYLVTRAYQTRHGNGPMTNEEIPHNISEDPNETNVENWSQGKFRRTLLDLDLLLYGLSREERDLWYVQKNCIRTLVITCLDHVKNEWRFTHKGEVRFSASEANFIDKIAYILGSDNVLVSHSPYSENIQTWPYHEDRN